MIFATWNVHRGRGADGVVDPARIARTIAEDILPHRPDALALVEADEETSPHRGVLDLALIERESGLRSVHVDSELRWSEGSHGFLGVVLLLRPSLEVVRATVLDLPGHCPRGAVVVEARIGLTDLRIIATHLALSQVLRVAQMRVVGQFLRRQSVMPTVLAGDLNEWRPWGGLAFSERIAGMTFDGPAPATWPVRRPFLALDRILVSSSCRVSKSRVLDSPLIRAASDHRPLVCSVDLARD